MSPQALQALRRALNRDAPEGYEDNPAWTAAQTTVPMLEQRSRDRIDVANRASQAHMFESGDWAPDREYAPAGLEGLMEGLFHNDNAANIDPAGNVQGNPRAARVRWGTFGPHQPLGMR